MKKIILFFLLVLASCSAPKYSQEPVSIDEEARSASPAPAPPPPAAIPDEPHYLPGETEAGGDDQAVAEKITPSNTQDEDKSIFEPSKIIEQLRYSAFGYSVPKEANIDDDIEIAMIVNPLVTVKEIEEDLPEGERTTGNIQISRVVQAKLDSNDFNITSITPERQVVIGGRNTTWKWSLKAKSPGANKKVKITVSAIVLVDGERTESYIDTYTNTININITPKQRISRWLDDNWQWAWGALLIPILGFFYNRKRKK